MIWSDMAVAMVMESIRIRVEAMEKGMGMAKETRGGAVTIEESYL